MTEALSQTRIEPAPKWVRGYTGGRKVVDSRSVKLVWTHPHYPTWFFPVAHVDEALAGAEDTVTIADLPEHVSPRWEAVDRWFEEEVEVFVHPRSPYTRVDALPSSRHVEISIDGTVVADSNRPTILFETGLPTRFYLPATDVRFELLTPTDTTTACPYKGLASYWTVTIDGNEHRDVVWSYRTPLPESEAIAGMLCFFDERVDVEVDGVAQHRPRTEFG